jgi:hypothetical protein
MTNFRSINKDFNAGIPAKIFTNHFYAKRENIHLDKHKFDLKKVSFFNSVKVKNQNLDK